MDAGSDDLEYQLYKRAVAAQKQEDLARKAAASAHHAQFKDAFEILTLLRRYGVQGEAQVQGEKSKLIFHEDAFDGIRALIERAR